MSKQATQECLSGKTLKLAARVEQGVGGPVLKSGSLELHSVEEDLPSREKALLPAGRPRAGHHLSLGPGFLSLAGKTASVDSVPLFP